MGQKFMGIMMIVLGIVVSAILLPMQNTACATVLSTNNSNLTGLATVVPIVPLFILVMVFFGSGMLAFNLYKGGAVGASNILRLVMGQLVIFFALTIFPIIETTFNTLYDASSATVQPVVAVMPLIILVALVFGSGWWLMLKTGGKDGKSSRAELM